MFVRTYRFLRKSTTCYKANSPNTSSSLISVTMPVLNRRPNMRFVTSYFPYLLYYLHCGGFTILAFYPSTVKDHIVTKRVYQSIETQDWLHCLVTCQSDAECSSYNFKLDENEAGNNCELSKCGGEKETTLISKQGFVFQQLKPVDKNVHLCEIQRDKITKPSQKSIVGLESSVILQSRLNPAKYMTALQDYLSFTNGTWIRCYHSGEPGLNQTAFHQLCDSKGPTVTIVRVEKYIFGGYIDIPWKASKPYCFPVLTNHAFIFTLYNQQGFKPYKFKVKPGNIAAYHCADQGPSFGFGYDLVLYGGRSTPSYARCHSYEKPPNCSYNVNVTCTFYTGKTGFIPSDIEVFYEV